MERTDFSSEMGTRVADRTKVQLEEMIKTGIGNPGLSHYLKFVHKTPFFQEI